MEFTLLGAAALAMGSTYATLWREGRRENAPDRARELRDLALGAALGGLIVGRLAAMIGDGVNPLANIGDVLIVRAGVDTVWATFGALATMVTMARRETVAAADALAGAALAGLAGWEAGCAVRSTCAGTVADLPWAITLPGSAIPRHPVGLYAAAGMALVAIGILWLRRRRPAPGVVAALGLAGAATVRLATEAMRPALGGRPTVWYAAAMVAGVGLALLALRRDRLRAPS